MTKDTGECREVPETAEKVQPQSPQVGEVGEQSMQGTAQKPEWTEEDQALLDEVHRLREKEAAELEQERIKYLREVELPRGQKRLQDTVQGKSIKDEGSPE